MDSFWSSYIIKREISIPSGGQARSVKGIEGWVSCFEKARLAGTVFAGGVDGTGAIHGHTAIQTAYDMGKAI